MSEENKNIYISFWLLLITFLVAIMIIVGGLTRLTGSGLSITEWNLISGIIPPLSLNKWQYTFSLYQEIPEFKLENSSMTLTQFKFIYWWEYVHRLLGRLIGLIFIIPLIFITLKKLLNKKTILSLYLIFFLICFQGFVGWYMVQSGLTEKTDVSHYRLSLHLIIAFIIYILLLWNYLINKSLNLINRGKQLPYSLPIVFISLILIQISIGALVSGLDAGQIYQTWPLMNQKYFPDDVLLNDLLTLKIFEIPSLVQFLHRNIAYFIFLFFLFMTYVIFKSKKYSHLKKITLYIFGILFLQTVLGILTIISGAQIFLASMHQIGSILLISASLILVYKNTKIS